MIKEQTRRLWTNKDLNGIPVPIINCGPDIPHFHDLPEKDRMAVFCWLLLNIRPAKPGTPAAYMTSQDVAELASFITSVCLNTAQVREALLLLAIAPWDASGRDWVYRLDRDSPCAMLAPDGNGGLVVRDRSCHVKSVGAS